ncbi:hypothetical protein [Archaeoglobus veneficus]|uniref:Uncharacterized protein n=1 Tax=Archaeoglobus veneficus (strain DSM 11195 / SNP6) TaxID=693661 RepID=F2KR65_ARCVS|nr:hypothetical protein [Archaeoglobus veneficus]AEA46702.1 hypothetical protein Arcve_0682 [Archaeoglobus veneficus SNP6]
MSEWTISEYDSAGDITSVVLDSVNAVEGNYCLKLKIAAYSSTLSETHSITVTKNNFSYRNVRVIFWLKTVDLSSAVFRVTHPSYGSVNLNTGGVWKLYRVTFYYDLLLLRKQIVVEEWDDTISDFVEKNRIDAGAGDPDPGTISFQLYIKATGTAGYSPTAYLDYTELHAA